MYPPPALLLFRRNASKTLLTEIPRATVTPAQAEQIVARQALKRRQVPTDLVGVVDGGRLVELGTHADLVAKGGAYARLYATWVAGTGAHAGAA